MPNIPDTHALFVLGMVVVALVLFAQSRIRVATSGLIVLGSLILFFSLFPYEGGAGVLRAERFLSGFGHPAVIAICALMAMGQGIVVTGVLNPLERVVASVWKRSRSLAQLATLTMSAVTSAFVNNTPIVVMVLPILTSAARRAGVSPSKALLPMGYATLLGGTTTTIGTSTNLLVVGTAASMSDVNLSMFDFTLLAAAGALVGLLYLWLIAPRLLADRALPMADTSPRLFQTQMALPSDTEKTGLSVSAFREKSGGRIQIQMILRGGGMGIVPLPDVQIHPGDTLYLLGTPECLVAAAGLLGVEWERDEDAIRFDHNDSDETVSDESDAVDPEPLLAEIVVTEGSLLDRRTLDQARFEDWSGTVAVALHRQQTQRQHKPSDLGSTILRAGDVLLVQGTPSTLSRLRREGRVLLLDSTTSLPFTSKAPLAVIILAATIACAAAGLFSITIAAVLGLAAMVVTGCLQWKNIAGAISISVVMVIVTSLALAEALSLTGGSDFLAQCFLWATDGLQPLGLIFALMGMMGLLTNVVSNSAAAVIGTPVAITIARSLDVSAEPFVLAVLFGVNLSYATPMAYQTNLIIMNAARYRFSDFLKVGLPLVLIMWVSYWLLISWFYADVL